MIELESQDGFVCSAASIAINALTRTRFDLDTPGKHHDVQD